MKQTSLLTAFLVLGCNSDSKQNVSHMDSIEVRTDSIAQVRTDSISHLSVESAVVAPLSGTAPPNDTLPLQKGTPSKTFGCNSPVRAHDTLTIRMPQPHGQYLAIRYPSGHFYYVVYPTHGVPGRVSLIESGSFRSLNEIRLVVGETKGTPWVYQKDVPEALLSEPGKYRIIVNDNMDSDVGSSIPEYSCVVSVLAPH